MKPAPFDYHAPSSLEEAVAVVERFGDDAKVLAGGQSLVPMLALRLTRFDHLVDLGRIEGLRGVTRDDGMLRIGAMTRHVRVGDDPQVAAAAPLLTRATPLIGHFQIRNRGTIGGSLAHADPAAEYPAVLLALDGAVEATGPRGTRTIPAAELFASTWETTLEPTEILTAVLVPAGSPGSGSAVREVARRHGDFALAGTACVVRVDGSRRIASAAIGLFGLDGVPCRAHGAEAALAGEVVDGVDLAAVGHLAMEGLDPPSDVHAPGSYRRRVGAVLVAEALRAAIDEATGAK